MNPDMMKAAALSKNGIDDADTMKERSGFHHIRVHHCNLLCSFTDILPQTMPV